MLASCQGIPVDVAGHLLAKSLSGIADSTIDQSKQWKGIVQAGLPK